MYASVVKIPHPREFALAIENYHILPFSYSLPLALILPWLEAICGSFIILGLFTRTGAGVILVLLLVFIGALASALFRGLDIACGCFDLKSKPSSAWGLINYIFRDIILVFFACLIITSSANKFSLANILPAKIKRLVD